MEYRDSSEDLTKIISSLLKEEAAELVEMKLTRSEGKILLRLLIDNKSGGITLGVCAHLNRRIGEILEESDLIKES
jgi:ribosome maturation factor RimP